jgi:putative transposase
MARMARVVVPFYPHHVTQRGNRRQRTFFADDDYTNYIKLLSEFCCKSATRVWAYCLMPNHVHLVLVPSHADGLRAALGEAHRRYTRDVNFRKGWCGHLWQERFHSFPMDEDYLLATVRYVERNPVAAGLCESPQDWPWSSAAAHLSGRDDGLVEVQAMLSRIDNWSAYLSDGGDDEIGAHIAKHSRTGRPLGGESFVQRLERITGRRLSRRSPGPRTETAAR